MPEERHAADGRRTATASDVLEQDERPHLLRLPGDDFACDERAEVAVGKTPHVRFHANDYSVPADRVRRSLTVVATPTTVGVLDGTRLVAEHARSLDRGAQIEDPRHLAALTERKRRARALRGLDRLAHAVPSSQQMMTALAEGGENLGSATSWMLRLLDDFGAAAVDRNTGYLRNQHGPLRCFLEDGRIPIDNNACERAIRPIAVRRRNWLFAGGMRGGRAAAVVFSLAESCRIVGIDPIDYFADVLVRVGSHPASRVDELVPANWARLFAPDAAEPTLPA